MRAELKDTHHYHSARQRLNASASSGLYMPIMPQQIALIANWPRLIRFADAGPLSSHHLSTSSASDNSLCAKAQVPGSGAEFVDGWW
ncbi:MAG: hypothetical protein V4724_26400, partial [Pseudomonadota bacterium]